MTRVITIDGPSGTGKTTVAKRVADALGFAYFDTGAMYRALTWQLLDHNIPLDDEKKLEASLEHFAFRIVEDQGKKHYFVGEREVTEVIRSSQVTQAVSEVSALSVVRSNLLKLQHQFATGQDAVFEGRDLGTVVFPKAQFKVFLTADVTVRATRRLKELLAKKEFEGLTHEKVLEALEKRDAYDSGREVAPLRCPEDAFTLDTTNLSIDEVVNTITKEFQKRATL